MGCRRAISMRNMLEVLEHLGIHGIRPDLANRQVQISCPLAPWTHERGSDDKPSMGINFSSHPAYCHCFACGYSGNIYNLLYKYGAYKDNPEIKKLSKTLRHENRFADLKDRVNRFTKFEEEEETTVYLLDSALRNFPSVKEYKRALDYLDSREISSKIQDIFDLRYDTQKDTIVMPVRSKDGRLVGATGRYLEPQGPKYYHYFGMRTQYTLGGYHLLGDSKRVVLVEGPFCLMRGYEWKFSLDYEILCTFGAKISGWQAGQISSFADSVLLGYDNDTAGDLARDAAFKHLYGSVPSVRAINFPKGQDTGSSTFESYKDLITNAQRSLV